jgi:NDP-sugar pyrophosphorylase family protein
MPVPLEEASRFGILITDDNNKITEFEEKPANPRSNLASMGIYIFSWKVLKEALIKMKDQKGCDFGKHIIPYCFEHGSRIFAYEYNGYWRGPIWAPSTYLIVDGLNRMGRTEEARLIAKRFVEMCAFKAKGNYENFDPFTGQGLCAPGYTWTASVYLCLLWEYCM